MKQTLEILGKRYDTKFAPVSSDDLYEGCATIDLERHTITIANDVPLTQQIDNVIHEAVHALQYATGEIKYTEEDEAQAHSVACLMTQILCEPRNRWFLEMIIAEMEEREEAHNPPT